MMGPNGKQQQSLGGYGGADVGQDTSLYEEMKMLKATQQAILSQIGGVAEATTQVAATVAEEPELKSLTLEGVSLTLKDVNLTLPSQQRDKAREAQRDKTFGSVDQRLGDISQKLAYLTEVTHCLACPPDNQVIQNNLLGKPSNLEVLAQSCLKTQPKVLFRHNGKVTHHLGPVGQKYIIARSSMQQAEIRHLDSGREVTKLAI